MIIDVHAHFFAGRYLDALEAGGAKVPDAHRTGAGTISSEQRLDLMGQAGIDVQILSVSGLLPDLDTPGQAADAAELGNDLLAAACADHQDRLRAFAVLPLPHIDRCLVEAARALGELGMAGVTMACAPAGLPLDDSRLTPLFAELDRVAATVFLHPQGRSSSELSRARITWSLGALVEDTLAVLALARSGFAERFPRLKFIVPHLGGVTAMFAHRLARESKERDTSLVRLLDATADRRVWFDVVNGDPHVLSMASRVLGIDRLLFGTDFPFVSEGGFQECVDYVRGAGLGQTATDAILAGNAERLFGMPANQSIQRISRQERR